MIGVSQEALCHYESGKDRPGYFTLTKLAQALDVTTDYLLGLTERETPPSEFGELHDLQELELIEIFRSLCPTAKQRTVAYAQGGKGQSKHIEKAEDFTFYSEPSAFLSNF